MAKKKKAVARNTPRVWSIKRAWAVAYKGNVQISSVREDKREALDCISQTAREVGYEVVPVSITIEERI